MLGPCTRLFWRCVPCCVRQPMYPHKLIEHMHPLVQTENRLVGNFRVGKSSSDATHLEVWLSSALRICAHSGIAEACQGPCPLTCATLTSIDRIKQICCATRPSKLTRLMCCRRVRGLYVPGVHRCGGECKRKAASPGCGGQRAELHGWPPVLHLRADWPMCQH